MKIAVFISAFVLTGITGFSQQRVVISKEWQNHAVRVDDSYYQVSKREELKPPYKASCLLEENIGTTYYDLQTTSSMQKHLYAFDDGSMGSVWTMGFDYPAFGDRGTGYNYYDGANWGPFPGNIIESNRSGWAEYAPYGENGEIIVSHISGADSAVGLTLSKRENKGTGAWEELNFLGPPECDNNILWPRIVTGGVNHSVIHLLAVTPPTSNCGFPYMDQEIAILYSRSFDGGNSWNPENYIIPEINSNYYNGFSADVYDITADGDRVGILIGDPWIGLLLLKSTDGGDTWEKTIIWDHPYPFHTYEVTDTFYCADGAHSLAFDNDGMAHVVFGINRTYADVAGTYWFPAVDGIGYWNENRPTFSNNLNALSPYGDPGSELVENYSLIGWTQDINGNGLLDLLPESGIYYLGFSSMPQIVVNEENEIFVVYSSVTETYNNGLQNYRHIWARNSPNGITWNSFIHLTSSICHCLHENVFPSLTSGSESNTYVLSFQYDIEPGLAVRGDNDPYTENFISFMEVDGITGTEENGALENNFRVSQNHPNPFSSETKVKAELNEAAHVSLILTTLTGQKVLQINKGYLQAGVHIITLHAAGLNPGLYFYTIKAGEFSDTKKMIIK